MRLTKEARKLSRKLFQASFTVGRLDREKVGAAVQALLASKPRHYLQILKELETQIAGLKTTTAKTNVGIVREAGDGVAKIEGLSDVMLNEMIEFPGGLYGLALNLEETEVGCILLGDYTQVTEGTEVKTTGRLLQVPVGKGLLG